MNAGKWWELLSEDAMQAICQYGHLVQPAINAAGKKVISAAYDANGQVVFTAGYKVSPSIETLAINVGGETCIEILEAAGCAIGRNAYNLAADY